MSAFAERLRELAVGFEISEVDEEHAMVLIGKCEACEKQCPLTGIVYPSDDEEGLWEFVCPSFVATKAAEDFPQVILATLLEDNSKMIYGYWAIINISEDMVALAFMHNAPEKSLTPAIFRKICEVAAERIKMLQGAMKECAREVKEAIPAWTLLGAILSNLEDRRNIADLLPGIRYLH